MKASAKIAALFALFCIPSSAQQATVRPASPASFPGPSDSNSPALRIDGGIVIYNSTGLGPIRTEGPNQFQLQSSEAVSIDLSAHRPYWIEAAWADDDGTIFAWYHHEPGGLCGGLHLTAPQIGALISYDGGRSFRDMGIVLTSSYGVDCSSQNGYFGGGNGDFTVVPSRDRAYFYFLFSAYGGPVAAQGVALARMPFDRRHSPSGAVEKYYKGKWTEPGLNGRVSPIFPAAVNWRSPNADAFWGPSVHWNRYLGKFVMLLNRSCCSPGWPQEGVYVSFNASLADPAGWSAPVKILSDVFWYPQVIGRGKTGTDKEADKVARLYVYGSSEWEIVFEK